MRASIKTYNTEAFLRDHTLLEHDPHELVKPDAGHFFVVRVQEMLRSLRLPVPPTRATIHTLIWLTEGEATMSIGSETYRIGRNECLVVAAGQVFSFANRDVNKGYQCSFHSDFLSARFGGNDLLREFDFLRIWGDPCIRPEKGSAGFVRSLLERMRLEYAQNGLADPVLLQSCLLAFLAELNRAARSFAAAPRTMAANITNRFRELLPEHLRTTHQVAAYAALLNISPNHLNKSVKTVTGKSAARWIAESIVLEAKVLLHQSTMSVGEIAAELGFFDQSYFSRLFKKHEGMTPLEFRRSIGC